MSKAHDISTALAIIAAVENNTGVEGKLAKLLGVSEEELNTFLLVATTLINASR